MITSVLVLSLVISAQCIQHRSNQLSNTLANGYDGRLTRPRQQWTSNDETDRWQQLSSVNRDNKWKISSDIYRWNMENDNNWKPNMMYGTPKWSANVASGQQFGRNKFSSQTINGQRYPRVNYWMQRPNKVSQSIKQSVREKEYRADMRNKATYTRPEGLSQAMESKPWYQFDANGNIWVFDQTEKETGALNYEPSMNMWSERSGNMPTTWKNQPMLNKAAWNNKASSTTNNMAVILPYAVPEHIIVPVPKPMPIRVEVPQPVAVPIVHNIPYTIEKPVPYPVISEVPQPFEKLVPVSVEVPKMVPYEVPVYTHLYPVGKKWHQQTKY